MRSSRPVARVPRWRARGSRASGEQGWGRGDRWVPPSTPSTSAPSAPPLRPQPKTPGMLRSPLTPAPGEPLTTPGSPTPHPTPHAHTIAAEKGSTREPRGNPRSPRPRSPATTETPAPQARGTPPGLRHLECRRCRTTCPPAASLSNAGTPWGILSGTYGGGIACASVSDVAERRRWSLDRSTSAATWTWPCV